MSKPRRGDELIIAIDQGTSSLKVVAFDLSGRLVKSATAVTEIRLLGGDTMEGSPERWWWQCASSLRRLLADPSIEGARVRAVAVCGLMHTLVPADVSGTALVDVVPLWADQRYRNDPSPAYDAVRERITDPSENSCVGRLAWLLDRHPTLRSRLCRLLPVKDFLRFKLTNESATDYYEAEGTGLSQHHGTKWSSELLDIVGIPAATLPHIVPPDDQMGEVTAAAALATGLAEGIPVVVGTSDWHAALIGSEAFLPERVSLYLGTAGVLGAFRSRRNLSTLGEAVCLGAVTSTGSALDWLAQTLAPAARDRVEAGSESIAELANRSDAGAHGLIFLPHLMGERGDAIRSNATGTLTGLRLTHNRCDLARAVLEGTAMWLRAVADRAIASEQIDSLVISGGGARQPLNATIAAAIHGLPVIVPEIVETGALGAAVLAAQNLGILQTNTGTASGWVRTHLVEEPIPWLVDRYAEIYETFVRTEHVMRALEQVPPSSSGQAA